MDGIVFLFCVLCVFCWETVLLSVDVHMHEDSVGGWLGEEKRASFLCFVLFSSDWVSPRGGLGIQFL